MKILITVGLIFNVVFTFAQYTADFTSFGKGVSGDVNCSNVDVITCGSYEVSGVDWFLSSPGNSFNITGEDDGLYAVGDGLFLQDTDGVLCWESPMLAMDGNAQTISVSGNVDNWDNEESITLNWFVDGASSSVVLFPEGTQPFAFNPATNSGNTLQFQLCANSHSNSDRLTYATVSTSASVLPIELLGFKAYPTDDENIRLQWKTVTEINNDRFEIQKSQNNNDFIIIGEIKGNGSSNILQEYSFTDINPFKGMNYYRLKQIDYDDQFEYSPIISMDHRVDEENNGVFYPNPTKSGTIVLDYNSTSNEDLKIAIFEISGELVLTKIIEVTVGNNNLDVDLSTLQRGVYHVRLGDKINLAYRKLIIH